MTKAERKARRGSIAAVSGSERSRYTKALGKARRKIERELRAATEPTRGDDETVEAIGADPLVDDLPDLG